MKEEPPSGPAPDMGVTAHSRLETLQVYKLLQCVRREDTVQITKLCTQGIPMLINYRDPRGGECALHLAAQSNNERMTQFLLKLGAIPNVQDFKGRTPVMKAADYGHDKTVEILAEAGADLSMKDKEDRDVLSYCLSASTKRHKKCLEIILAYGAQVNNTNDSTKPTLVIACENSLQNETMCLMLLEKGADPNSKNKATGRSAISEACASGSGKVVQKLLEKGADPNLMDRKHLTPVHYAAQMGVFDAIKSLAAYGADCAPLDKEGNNALHFAAEGGFAMICKYLAQRGCNPKQKNTDGFTPRLLAKEKSYKDASKELRKAEKTFTKYSKPGAKNPNDPQVLGLYDWTCERMTFVRECLMRCVMPADELHSLKGNFVTQQDFDDIMKQLAAPIPDSIRNRLHDVHDKERKGIIEVDEFLSGKKYIAKAYLMSAFEGKKKKKGKKGKKGGKGKKGKLKIPMPICIEKDGPRRPDGGPPYKYVEKQVLWTDTSRFTRDHPPKHPLQDDSAWYLQQPEKQYMNINDAVKLEDMESLKRAFESGTEVDTRDKYFKTPLMASCAEGNLELTNYLLSIGASVEARDNFKWTPLHHACHSGQLDVVKALLYAGADGNAVTWNGATPLMRAIESCKVDIVRFLLECGANVIVANKKEKTALDVARDWADSEIYRMVKEKYDAAPKPKKDKKGKLKKPPQKPLTIPPIPQGRTIAPGTVTQEGDKEVTPPKIPTPAPYTETPRPASTQITPREQEKPPNTYPSDGIITKPIHPDDIVFTPRKAWTEQPTTQRLLEVKQEKRDRFGDEIDFETYEKPLKQNISRKITQFQTQT